MSTEYAGNPANYPTTITRPSDGDNKSAASVNNGFEDLADRTAFLHSRSPVTVARGTVSGGTGDTPALHDTITSASWTEVAGIVAPELAGCEIGDFIEVRCTCQADVASGTGILRLLATEDYGVTDVAVELLGSKKWINSTSYDAVALEGIFQVTTAGTVRVALEGYAVGGINLRVRGGVTIVARRYAA
jgi:hypothetical protein